MKLAIVAFFLCIAVACASPTSSSLEEFSSPLETIVKKFEAIFHKIYCAGEVIGNVVGPDELKEDFDEFKRVAEVFIVNWQMCGVAGSKEDFSKCKIDSLKAFIQSLQKFDSKIRIKHDGLGKVILHEVSDKCCIDYEYLELVEDTIKLLRRYAAIIL